MSIACISKFLYAPYRTAPPSFAVPRAPDHHERIAALADEMRRLGLHERRQALTRPRPCGRPKKPVLVDGQLCEGYAAAAKLIGCSCGGLRWAIRENGGWIGGRKVVRV